MNTNGLCHIFWDESNVFQYLFVFQGYTSDYLTVQSGVPQGSILGPLIFCVFINEICMLNLNSNTILSLYADDTAIF